MPINTVTLVLEGDVSLATFAKAVESFNELVQALSDEVGHAGIDWVLDDLQLSSGVVTAKGDGESEAAERVVAAYEEVGAALESNLPIRGPKRVQKAARKIVSITDIRTKAVRFETARRESTVSVPDTRKPPLSVKPGVPLLVPSAPTKAVHYPAAAYGGIQGRIQTLTNRGSLRFTLYDLLYDKAVSCYFTEGKQDLIKDAWGKMAVIEGLISRDPVNGRPLAIRQVSNITVLPEPYINFEYQDARGAVPSLNGISPEDAIRRIRDAQ